MEGYIYKVINKHTNKVYIGQTSRTINERWEEHVKNAYHDNNLEFSNKFHRSIRQYGAGGFIVVEQEKITASNKEDLHQKLDDAEIKWISYFDSKDNGYNSTLGGDFNPMYGVTGKDNPCSVRVNQYDLNGHFIKTWDSFADINRELGYNTENIICVCKPDRLDTRKVTAYDFVWRYHFDYPDNNDIVISQEELDIRNAKTKAWYASKPIDQLDDNGNVIQTFNSVNSAAEAVNSRPSGISNVLSGRRKTCKGFKWRYHIE